MRYRTEQRIETLADNAVMRDGRMEAAFSIEPVRYSHWDFDPSRGWPSDYWLAEACIEAENRTRLRHNLPPRVEPRRTEGVSD